MYDHLQGMTPRQIQHRSRGGMILRFIGDLSMLRTWISRGLLGGAVALIVLIPPWRLIVLNYRIGLILIAVLAAGAAVSFASGQAMRRATRTMRRRRSLLISNLDEQINALPVVQVFGRSGASTPGCPGRTIRSTAPCSGSRSCGGGCAGSPRRSPCSPSSPCSRSGLLEVRRGRRRSGWWWRR